MLKQREVCALPRVNIGIIVWEGSCQNLGTHTCIRLYVTILDAPSDVLQGN